MLFFKKKRTEDEIIKEFNQLGYKEFVTDKIVSFQKTINSMEIVTIEIIFTSKKVKSFVNQKAKYGYERKEIRFLTFKEIQLIDELIKIRKRGNK